MNINKSRITLILFFTLLCICHTPGALAQGYIDEDFLDNIENNARFMLSEQSQVFNNNSVPAKWNNESAVVIG